MPSPSDPQTPTPVVRIGRYTIGANRPPMIVAEAGVNHNGNLDTALRMIDAAVAAGADAIKFQMFRTDELVSPSAPTARYQRNGTRGRSQRSMLKRLELSLEEFGRIRQHCDQPELLFLATPFTPADVARLAGLGVEAVKIASTDLRNAPLLAAAARTNLPLIVSTGASRPEEITAAVDQLAHIGAVDRLMLLHCVSCYPTPLETINLRAVAALERQFGRPVGLSDHTTSTRTGAWAVAAGACTLEKHFTLDRAMPGPDHAMSLTPDDLAVYIHEARAAASAMGSGRIGMTESEAEVRNVASKSVVAAVDIPPGAPIQPDMLTLKRPGTGIAPADLPTLTGRKTRVPIPRNTVIAWDMLT